MPPVSIDPVTAQFALAVAGLVAGMAVERPHEELPDVVAVADTVDAVAAAPHPTTAEHPTEARAFRVADGRIHLRGPSGWSAAPLSSGPVLGVGDGPLGRVLSGAQPCQVFESVAALERAVGSVRERAPVRHAVDGRIRARKVQTVGAAFTLVGG